MIDLTQQQKISQQQHISLRQKQSLDLLSLSIPDLQERINQEITSNPLLEYENYPGSTLESSLPEDDFDGNFNADDDSENDLGNDDWHDELPVPGEGYEDAAELQQKRDFLFSSFADNVSLHDKLMQELGVLELSSGERELAEAIVVAIGDDGLLKTDIIEIAQASDVDLFEAEEMLLRLQKIFPPGIGARDLKECLKLQLEAAGEADSDICNLLEHLDDLARNRMELLASKLKISLEELNILAERIRKLDPHPGRALSSAEGGIVIPEVEIFFDGEEYALKSHDEIMPKLKISDYYENMLQKNDLPDDVRSYLKEKMAAANDFTLALERREKTIIRIARFIMETQHDFLENGMEAIRPMTMMQAAQVLGVHETTISRGCAGKYMATPHGIFEFKFFFAGGFTDSDGGEISTIAIKEKIRDIIESEDPEKPLSDEKISKMLQEDGLSVARRTIAKYREQMNIPGTSMRRKY